MCSWTKEIKVAEMFLEVPIFIKEELENSDNVKGIIYKKEDEFFDFGKLCNELKSWWESQKGKGVYSEDLIECTLEDFINEDELLGSFEIGKVEEVFSKEIKGDIDC